MEFLKSIDLAVFYFFNNLSSHPVLDAFFAFITNVKHWYPVYIVALVWLVWKGGKKGRVAALLALILVVICDQTGNLIKELTMRPRPGEGLTDALNPLGLEFKNTKSFPSNHALNNFAIAAFFSGLYKKWSPVLYIIATFIAISRIYLAMHYPSDVLAGAALGILFGGLFVVLHKRIVRPKS